jgi:predicted HAD superfamily Cof-like phosphohydrolase
MQTFDQWWAGSGIWADALPRGAAEAAWEAARKQGDPGVERVREFHEAFGCVTQPGPWMPELDLNDREIIRDFAQQLSGIAWWLKHQAEQANGRRKAALGLLLVRLQMHVEEGGELAEAWAEGSLVKVLDALTDISYVTDGTYLTHGLDRVKVAADEEVHRSNMSKLDLDGKPIIHASGRVVKPPHYSPPDLAPLLE